MRIFLKCRRTSAGCVEWTGTAPNGYGMVFPGAPNGELSRVSLDGKPRRLSPVPVHVAVWETYMGPVPKGLQLDHLCKNKRCCRIDHLEAVTARVNSRRRSGWYQDSGAWYCSNHHRIDEINSYERVVGQDTFRTVCRKCRAAFEERYRKKVREKRCQNS